jgi:hypothetical protein
LGARDIVIGMELIPRRGDILLLASDGKGKRVAVDQFPRQGRYGQGVTAWKLPRTSQLVGIAAGKPNTRVTIIIDKLSPKAIRLDDAPLQTRAASGKTIIELKPGHQVMGLSVSWVVPRAVAGEKTTPEKEPEVPEELEEPQLLEVEQLSFGMIEPVVKKTSSSVKIKSVKPRAETSKKTKQLPRKTRTTKAVQVALTTKAVMTRKASPTTKASRPKSAKAGTTRKTKTPAKADQTSLIDKKDARTEKTPAPKRGRPAAPKTTTTQRPITSTKTTKVKSEVKAPSPIKKRLATKTGKTKAIRGSTTTTGRKPATRVEGQSFPKPSKTRVDQAKPRKATSAKQETKKPTTRKPRKKKFTIKSSTTPAVVILPPSWKPKRTKASPSKRRVKTTKPKFGE